MTDKLREAAQQALEALEEPQDPVAYNGWVLREVLFDNGEPVGHREPPKAEQPAEQEPVGWVDDGGMVFWKDSPPADGSDIYTAPQPTIPPGYELADDERVAALCDLSYAAGMKAGWNFCVNDDDAGFERSQSVTVEAMRVLKKHRTMLAASPVKPAEQEPVAYVCTSSHVTADGSMEDGPDYLEWADEASDYEKRVGTPLYTAPKPAEPAEPLDGKLVMGLAVIRELTGTQKTDNIEATIEAVRKAVAPQPAKRVPLTDGQIAEIAATPCAVVGSYVHTFARAIEAAHGITGETK